VMRGHSHGLSYFLLIEIDFSFIQPCDINWAILRWIHPFLTAIAPCLFYCSLVCLRSKRVTFLSEKAPSTCLLYQENIKQVIASSATSVCHEWDVVFKY
jgi:hypothetical protein